MMIDVGTNNEKLLKDPLCKNHVMHLPVCKFCVIKVYFIGFRASKLRNLPF